MRKACLEIRPESPFLSGEGRARALLGHPAARATRQRGFPAGLLVVLGGWALLALVAAAGAGGKAPLLIRLRLADPRSPTIYVRYENGKLWVARSAERLRIARPLRLVRTEVWYDAPDGAYCRDREYAEVKLTGPIGRFTEVRMRPSVTAMLATAPTRGRPDPPEGDELFAPVMHFVHRDESGARWDYVIGCCWPLAPAPRAARADLVEVPVPDPRQLTLTLHAAVHSGGAEGQVELNVTARLGQEQLDDIRRDDKAVPVHVVFTDTRSQVAYSATTSLPKLLLSRGEREYGVRVPRGSYTVTVTMDRTPFSAPVTTTAKVVVK